MESDTLANGSNRMHITLLVSPSVRTVFVLPRYSYENIIASKYCLHCYVYAIVAQVSQLSGLTVISNQ